MDAFADIARLYGAPLLEIPRFVQLAGENCDIRVAGYVLATALKSKYGITALDWAAGHGTRAAYSRGAQLPDLLGIMTRCRVAPPQNHALGAFPFDDADGLCTRATTRLPIASCDR